jgi:methyl-accepting chemotaxis protein
MPEKINKMSLIDFHKAGINHLLWKRKVRAFLDDKQSFLKGEIGSSKKCELGSWLYTYGIKNYGSIKEVIELEKIHSKTHSLAFAAMEYKTKGDLSRAEAAYLQLDNISRELINKLTILGSLIQ